MEAVEEGSSGEKPVVGVVSSDEKFVGEEMFFHQEMCEIGQRTEGSILHHEEVRHHAHLLA